MANMSDHKKMNALISWNVHPQERGNKDNKQTNNKPDEDKC